MFLLLINLPLVNSIYSPEIESETQKFTTKTVIDENIGVLVEREGLEPNTYGYIIQLREKPILERKIEIDRNIGELEKKGKKYIKEAETLREGLSTELQAQKNKITLEHQTFLTKASTIIKSPEKKVIREFKVVFNGITLDISKSKAEELKKLEEVKEVYPNIEVKTLLMDSVPLINTDDVWTLGYTGEGITVAIIDTGIDYTHPDLGGCFGPGCKVVDGYDFVNDDSDPMDDHGHGTHCAGIVAGNESLKGIAPEAKLYAYKVCNLGGSCWGYDIIAAIELAQDPNQDGNYSDHVNVISMSLGGPGDPDDPMSQAVDTAVENGVAVVIAAGNSGPYSETVGSPGCARKAITVGATYKIDYQAFWWDCTPGEYISCGKCEEDGKVWCDYWGDGDPKADQITSFSSRGPTSVGTKPDVVAPGAIICSARYDYIFPPGEDPYYYPCLDEEHVQVAGTSMSTPIVAGAVALIKQAHPDWDTNEIKSALKITAIDIRGDINTQGYGRVDALEAVQLTSKPPVAIIETSGKIHGTQINVIGTGKAENFVNYTLYYKDVSYEDWEEVSFSTSPVIDDILCIWDISSLNDGGYMLKLETRSQTHIGKDIVYINIKNNEITYPGDLEDSFFHQVGEVFPSWKIIPINGTSTGYNFDHYVLERCRRSPYTDCTDEGITLTDDGQSPIIEDNLGSWDPSSLTESDFYYIKLTTYYTDKPEETAYVKIYVDTELHRGWPRKIELDTYGMWALAMLDQPTIADIDKDENNDLVFAYGRQIFVFNHSGMCVDGWPKKIETSCGYNATMQNGPAVADLDKDGFNEIVVGDNCGYLHVLNHDGSYVDGWPKDTGCYLITPTIADIDNSGYLDIIIGDWCSHLKVLNLTGDYLDGWPKYLPPSYTPSYYKSVDYPASVADLDKDGFNEIVVVSSACDWFIHDVKCETTRLWVLNHDGTEVEPWPKEFFDGGTYNSNPILADIDNDNEIEIIVGFYNGSIFVWNLDGTIVDGWPVATGASELKSPAIGDVNNDGNLEVMVTGYFDGGYPCLYTYSFDGNLLPEWPKCYDWPLIKSGLGGNPMLSDLDNDEDNEISVIPDGCSVMVGDLPEYYTFNPDSTIVDGWPKKIDDLGFIQGTPIGDIDNDGNNELVLYTWKGSIFVWDLLGITGRNEWPVFYHDERHTGLYKKYCSGEINLTLSPNPVEISSNVDVEIGGTDCSSYVFAKDSCYGVNPCPGMVCGVTPGEEVTCSCQFTSPDTVDYYTYYACLDKNGDGDYNDPGESDSETLTVFKTTCEDSDGGKNYYTKGEVATCTFYPEIGSCGGSVDTCDGNTLIEGYCEGNEGKSVHYTCPNGCEDGACIRGGGCPTLLVYNGKEFVKVEKLNIHAPEGIDTTYTTSFTMKPIDGQYKIILSEMWYALLEGSHIDHIKLTDEIGKECQLILAEHSKHGDVTSILKESDDVRIETKPGQDIELTFKGCYSDEFIFNIEGYNRPPEAIKLALSSAGILIIIVTIILVVIILFVFKFFVKK